MQKILTVILLASAFSIARSQTCVGTFHFRLFDEKTKKPLSEKEKLEKSIVYAFTKDEAEFYDDVQTVFTIDSVKRSPQGYTLHENEKGYSFFNNTDPSVISFATLCGLYLVHTEFFNKRDTMTLSFYNIPAHQSFQIDTVMFRKGHFFIDLQASNRLSDFSFIEDKGYFLIPRSLMEEFPKEEKN